MLPSIKKNAFAPNIGEGLKSKRSDLTEAKQRNHFRNHSTLDHYSDKITLGVESSSYLLAKEKLSTLKVDRGPKGSNVRIRNVDQIKTENLTPGAGFAGLEASQSSHYMGVGNKGELSFLKHKSIFQKA